MALLTGPFMKELAGVSVVSINKEVVIITLLNPAPSDFARDATATAMKQTADFGF
jgi:hypothetical protein